MYRKGGPAGVPLFSGRGNWGDCPHPMPLKQKFMPSVPALKQKSSCPLTLPWNKSSCSLALPWNKKVHALWPCPETKKIHAPLALPWDKSSCPLALPWNKKVHALWPCPETKVHAPLALPFLLHYWHYLLIPYHHNSVKSRLQGGKPESLNWRFWLPCCLKMRERGRIGTCSACLPAQFCF